METRSLFTIIIIILLITLLLYAILCEGADIYHHGEQTIRGGNGSIHYKGLGSEDESLEILLNRVYWAAAADLRNVKWKRSFIVAMLSAFGIIVIVFNRAPSAREVILIVLTIFIVTFASYKYFQYHADRFAPYYIRNNIKMVHQKLGLKYTDPGDPKIQKTPDYNYLSSLLSLE